MFFTIYLILWVFEPVPLWPVLRRHTIDAVFMIRFP